MVKKKLDDIWSIILGLLVLFFLCVIALSVLKYLGKLVVLAFESLAAIASRTDAVIVVAMITGSISIITVIISSIISKVIEYRNQTNRYLYEKREKPYTDFITMVYKIQQKTANKEEYSDKELRKDINEFSEALTLWGSSAVIKKWLKFRKNSSGNIDPKANLFILEEIIYEIRKDMGQRRKGMRKGDILSFFINDIDNYINNKKNR